MAAVIRKPSRRALRFARYIRHFAAIAQGLVTEPTLLLSVRSLTRGTICTNSLGCFSWSPTARNGKPLSQFGTRSRAIARNATCSGPPSSRPVQNARRDRQKRPTMFAAFKRLAIVSLGRSSIWRPAGLRSCRLPFTLTPRLPPRPRWRPRRPTWRRRSRFQCECEIGVATLKRHHAKRSPAATLIRRLVTTNTAAFTF